jgi:cytochrome c553
LGDSLEYEAPKEVCGGGGRVREPYTSRERHVVAAVAKGVDTEHAGPYIVAAATNEVTSWVKRRFQMKKTLLLASLAVGTFTLSCSLAQAAEDGAALYKSKCAMCHGADGAGKEGKVPALKGTSRSQEQIISILQKGASDKKAPHNAAFKGLNEDQAKAIAAYVKSMK